MDFPSDVFTEIPSDWTPRAGGVPTSCDITSTIDGISIISAPGNACFLYAPTSVVTVVKRNAFFHLQKIKGTSLMSWTNNQYPIFRFCTFMDQYICITFVPRSKYNCDLNESIASALCQCIDQLYNSIPNIIGTLDGDTVLKNSLQDGCREWKIYPNEWNTFAKSVQFAMQDIIEQHSLGRIVDTHFIIQTTGMNIILSDDNVPIIARMVNYAACVDFVIHLATELSTDGDYVMAWRKEFVDVICHKHGATYYCMGIPQVCNGQGKPDTSAFYRELDILSDVRYISLYSNMFKGVAAMSHRLNLHEKPFGQPFISKVLCYQPNRISSIRKKGSMKKLVNLLESGQMELLLIEILHKVQSVGRSHSVRIEVILSMMDITFNQACRNFTGDEIMKDMFRICRQIGLAEGPMMILDKKRVLQYVTRTVRQLWEPIRIVTKSFFECGRVASLADLNTINICEHLISFMMYGEKNRLKVFIA